MVSQTSDQFKKIRRTNFLLNIPSVGIYDYAIAFSRALYKRIYRKPALNSSERVSDQVSNKYSVCRRQVADMSLANCLLVTRLRPGKGNGGTVV